MIFIDISQKSNKSSAEHCNSKKIACYERCFLKCFFFQKFSQGNFCYYSKFFMLTLNLNTAHTPAEIKQNLLHWIFSCQDFCYFCQDIVPA